MQTSRKLTQFLFAALALVALAASALGQALPDPRNFPDGVPSDQRPGSVLVFPYYNSTVSGVVDTRLTITNTQIAVPNAANTVAIHLFLIAGCSAADMYMCLTPMGQFSIKASEWDPERAGYLIAVAVDTATGLPKQHNWLIGNAFVKDGDFVGNYGAEAFWKYTGGTTATGTMTFGVVPAVAGPPAVPAFQEYDAAPTGFLVEIQSPLDATQRLVHASIDGSASAPSAVRVTGTSRVYNQNEILKSFQFDFNNCLGIFNITNASIRTAPQLNQHIPSGQGGTLVYNTTQGTVGLIMTANRHNQTAVNWSGIRTIHKNAVSTRTLTIPVFFPTC